MKMFLKLRFTEIPQKFTNDYICQAREGHITFVQLVKSLLGDCY